MNTGIPICGVSLDATCFALAGSMIILASLNCISSMSLLTIVVSKPCGFNGDCCIQMKFGRARVKLLRG